jgi:serine/threonine-protein kinase
MKCTQKNPDRRYQNMGEVIKDLKYSLVNPDAMIAVVDEEDNAGKTKVSEGVGNPIRQNRQPMEQADDRGEYENYDNGYDNGYENYEGYESQEEQVQTPPVLNTVWEERVPKQDYYGSQDELKPNKKRKNTVKNKKANTKAKPQAKKKSKTKAKRNTYENYEGYDDYDYSQERMNRQNVRRNEYEQEDGFSDDEYDYNPKVEGLKTFLTIIAAIIIGCILLYFVAQATGVFEQIASSVGSESSASENVGRGVMPEFSGIDVDKVKDALNEQGLGYKTKYVENTQYAKNQVIAAALEDGTEVLPKDKILLNTTIVLTVSAGANGVEVPSVEGYTEAEATAALTTAGFQVIKEQEYSAEYAKGIIISQSPVGNSVAPLETEITIVISMGSEGVEVKMPTVTGQSEEAAISTLEAAGLTVGNVEPSYSDYPEGQICYQSYAPDTSVNSGTIVDLKVSIGVETVTYNCNVMVEAPSDYTGGNAEVILTTADGTTQLWYSQNVTSFPVSINLNGFTSPSAYGIVTISYFRNTETIVTDADGNMTTQVTPTLAQTQQNVQFTQN